MAAISGTDLALTTARVGAARVGSFRVGFIPCATTGPGSPWFGEYIWDELKPPTTQWTLLTEDCVCGQHPEASFSNVLCNAVGPVAFTDTSTPIGEITSWYWDFGDGGTSTDQNPTHVYAAGFFTVTLYVSGEKGTGSATGYVSVMSALVASATPNPAAVDEAVTFTMAPPPVNTTGLYGYWPLDEVSGTRAKTLGSATSADLAPFTVGVPSTAGRYGLAAQCVPAGFGNSPVLRNAALNPTLATDAGLTIAIWFKNQTLHYGAITESLFGLGRTVGNGSIGFFRSADTAWVPSAFLGDVHFMWIIDNAGTYNFTSQVGLGPFTRDVWHLAVIRVNSDGTFDVRIDGSTKEGDINTASYASPIGYATGSFTSTNYPRSMGALQLFNVWAPTVPVTWDYWHGEADDLRIWTRVLTDAEIEDLWAKASPSGGIPPYTYLWGFTYPKLFAAWNMDDVVGAVAGSSFRRDWLGNYDLTDQWAAPGTVALAAGKVGQGTAYALAGGTAFSNVLLTLPASFTITGWFKITNGTLNQYLISYGPNTLSGGVNIHVWPSIFTGVRFFTDDDGGDAADSGAAITLNVWHFFAATHDGVTGENTIQVDGSAPVSVAAQPNPAAAQALRLGRHSGGAGQLYGNLDAIQVFDEVLPQGEINVLASGWEPSTSTAEIPVVAFPTAGTVVASVTVTSATGCTATDTVDVTVNEAFDIIVTVLCTGAPIANCAVDVSLDGGAVWQSGVSDINGEVNFGPPPGGSIEVTLVSAATGITPCEGGAASGTAGPEVISLVADTLISITVVGA